MVRNGKIRDLHHKANASVSGKLNYHFPTIEQYIIICNSVVSKLLNQSLATLNFETLVST